MTPKMKCPSCGELMGDPQPYKSIPTLFQYSEPLNADEAPPQWFEDLPVSGHKFECANCGCKVDVPVRETGQ